MFGLGFEQKVKVTILMRSSANYTILFFKHGTTFCFEGRKIGERNKHFGINKYILNISSVKLNKTLNVK
jgi:hypothetical protein